MASYDDAAQATKIANVIVAKQKDPLSTAEVALIPISLAGQFDNGQLTWQKWLVDSIPPLTPAWNLVNSSTEVYLYGKFWRQLAVGAPGAQWLCTYKAQNGTITKVTSLNLDVPTSGSLILTNTFFPDQPSMVNFSGYALCFRP